MDPPPAVAMPSQGAPVASCRPAPLAAFPGRVLRRYGKESGGMVNGGVGAGWRTGYKSVKKIIYT